MTPKTDYRNLIKSNGPLNKHQEQQVPNYAVKANFVSQWIIIQRKTINLTRSWAFVGHLTTQ